MAVIRRISEVTKSLKPKQWLGNLSNRAFGSAAAVQYDDNDYEEEYEYDQRKPAAMVDTQGWAPERGVQFVMIGQPGARRHIFAERLSKLLQVPHISMATLVRQQLSPRSPLYQLVLIFPFFFILNSISFAFSVLSVLSFVWFAKNCE